MQKEQINRPGPTQLLQWLANTIRSYWTYGAYRSCCSVGPPWQLAQRPSFASCLWCISLRVNDNYSLLFFKNFKVFMFQYFKLLILNIYFFLCSKTKNLTFINFNITKLSKIQNVSSSKKPSLITC